MEDTEYRKQVREVFEGIVAAFDGVDPDVAEAEYSQGSVTILARGTKTILSPQPPVKQIWLAAAAQGIAVHFSYDPASKKWLDDKGRGYELYSFTEEVLQNAAGQSIKLSPGL